MNSEAIAQTGNIEGDFTLEAEELHWLVAVIAGTEQQIKMNIIDAPQIAANGEHFFRQWLTRWAQNATLRIAIEKVTAEIKRSPQINARTSGASIPACALDAADKRTLRSIPIANIRTGCNAFERAALVLHGYLGISAKDCAALLGCHPSAVLSSCSTALSHLLEENSRTEAGAAKHRSNQCGGLIDNDSDISSGFDNKVKLGQSS
jgi:DNA-directed RNA polymerase specialized sigma24 family protein